MNRCNTNDCCFFTCKECGSKKIIVEEKSVAKYHHVKELACTCGENSVAAKQKYHYSVECRTISELDEEHHFEVIETEEIENDDIENDDEEIFCAKCYSNADESDWEQTDDEVCEIKDDGFWVRCAKCKREIQFGWSHPDRGGRIWPVECNDFNPWKCWPEPRYKEQWKKNGWIRPDSSGESPEIL